MAYKSTKRRISKRIESTNYSEAPRSNEAPLPESASTKPKSRTYSCGGCEVLGTQVGAMIVGKDIPKFLQVAICGSCANRMRAEWVYREDVIWKVGMLVRQLLVATAAEVLGLEGASLWEVVTKFEVEGADEPLGLPINTVRDAMKEAMFVLHCRSAEP